MMRGVVETDAQAAWQEQATLFEELLDLPSAESRAALLEARTSNDPKLRDRVDRMLKAHYTATGFLPMPEAGSPGAPAPGGEMTGEKIGAYTLGQRLGEGGGGVVYLAEQEAPIRRRVALKIIKLGMDTRSVIARFEGERQTLAILNHPNIAKVIDAGATQSGRPFFVMELVEGLPITGFCDRHALGLSDRLELFLQVCSAVQHAHQKGIIHRDLKPSNILVATVDGVPVPKVIDFGVAKAIRGHARDGTVFTVGPQFIGTPAYMSPEQASLDSDVDTRADVYALGVLLYELLTGEPPLDPRELARLPFDELCRMIREHQPDRPSVRLARRSGGGWGRQAAARKTPGAAREGELGDLDWIIMKCLEKDRAQRYAGVSSLAADLQRFLRDEPVTARAPSALYLAGKAIRRHRVAFVAGTAIGTALVAGLAVASWQAARAMRAEKARAQEQRFAQQRLDASLTFISGMLRNVYPAFSDLVGARPAREALLRETLQLMPQLSAGAQQTADERRLLATLYLQLGYVQGWYSGSITGDYHGAVHSALECIRLVDSLPSHGEPELYLLVRAHMVAHMALRTLGELEASFHHLDWVTHHAEQLLASSAPDFQAHGRIYQHWAFGMRGMLLFDRGSLAEALEIAQAELGAVLTWRDDGSTDPQSYRFNRMLAQEGLGLMLLQANNYPEALRHLAEAQRFAREQMDQQPNLESAAERAISLQARLGQAFLSTGQWDRGHGQLDEAHALADDLARRGGEMGEMGEMLRFVILLAKAHGTAVAGLDPGNPRRRQDAEAAREALACAEALFQQLSAVPPFLQRDLEEARKAVDRLPR